MPVTREQRNIGKATNEWHRIENSTSTGDYSAEASRANASLGQLRQAIVLRTERRWRAHLKERENVRTTSQTSE